MSHEHEIEDLEQRTEQLQDRIDDVRADWERKRRDPSVPGAGTAEEIEGEAPESEGEGAPEVEDENS